MIETPLRIKDAFKVGAWTDPMEWAYFCSLPGREWRRARALAKRSTELLCNTQYADFIRSCGPVEKAGEFIFKNFLDYYCDAPYDIEFTSGNPYSPGFKVLETKIDVHTRMLKFAKQAKEFGAMGTCLNIEKFSVMVPELGLVRSADIYVFCGFDVDTKNGFIFGWTTAEKLAGIELSTDSKHLAKCIKLTDLYPIGDLLPYIKSR